jgi:NhaA family Na+:H+ antiporter
MLTDHALPRPKWMRFFTQTETLGGLLLMSAALLAIVMTNSPLRDIYNSFVNMEVIVKAGPLGLDKPLHLWINDGLMAIFFFLIGLEVRREVREGELASFQRALLPLLAALGGIVVPVAIFVGLNINHPDNMPGWAIPSATDIAFALGVLALLGTRIPTTLKVLLLAIAVIDDLAAIIIIALFYTSSLSTSAMMMAGLCLTTLFIMNRLGIQRPAAYILISFVLWAAVLKSGVHATLAGVAAAFFIPVAHTNHMEHALHPWVAFAIMPAFAFANAGVPLDGLSIGHLFTTLSGGIAAGLALGKPLGVFGVIWLAVKSGIAPMPRGLTWRHLFGMSLLCGVGLTMSLFIGTLAFPPGDYLRDVRIGIMGGSFISGILGYMVLMSCRPAQKNDEGV